VSFQDFQAFLPDGRAFLFSQESGSPARRGVFLGTLDSSPLIRVLPDPASVEVSPRGYLLYASGPASRPCGLIDVKTAGD
jgi:hypothetical protein